LLDADDHVAIDEAQLSLGGLLEARPIGILGM
jgi:hypothetical protein